MRAKKSSENGKSVKEIIDKLDNDEVIHKRSKNKANMKKQQGENNVEPPKINIEDNDSSNIKAIDEASSATEALIYNEEKNISNHLVRNILVSLVAVVVIAYIAVGYIKYNGKFLPNTVINGTDFSGMNVEEVCNYYDNKINNYTLDIYHDGYIIDKILPEKIDLALSYKAKWYFASLVKKQANIMWLPSILGQKDIYDIDYMDIMSYNVHKLNFFIADSVGYNLPVTIKSRQGSIYYNGNNFEIVPPVQSDQINPEIYIKTIYGKVQNLLPKMIIEEEDCYFKNEMTPEIEEKLQAACDTAQKFFDSKSFNFVLEDYDYDFNREVINSVYNISADYDFVCNENTIENGIEAIKGRYNTIGRERSFQTSHGTTVTVKGGDYGSYIDINTLEAKVKAALIDNEEVDEVIEYSRKTLDNTASDIGNTYVEIDLTNQYLYMYINGELVKQCPVVTGLPGARATPQGVYRLKNKLKHVKLVGDNYVTPVSYWMPFNQGIGMHDAIWQSAFGGDRYKRHGSHGCINLSLKNASDIYDYAIVNMPVICYYHERLPEFKEER